MSETHRRLIDRWLGTLQAWPQVKLVWVEGSLARGEAKPGSDIDLRVMIEDDAFEQLWHHQREQLLAGFGERLNLISEDWTRFLSIDGIIVEVAGLRLSELGNLRLHDWSFLLCRLPEQPTVIEDPRKGADAWPCPIACNPELVVKLSNACLYRFSQVPAPFYNGETCSVVMFLGYNRVELTRVMYHRIGIRFSKRYKHLSQVFPPSFLQDLAQTHTLAGEDPMDLAANARAFIRMSLLFSKHLAELAEKAGGGFDILWRQRSHDTLVARLDAFL